MREDIRESNKKFVENGEYEKYATSKYPEKKIAIVTCMDTRLVTMLPAALGIKNGDVKMIKNAGGLVTDPYSDSMRSLLVAIYELGVEEIMIIAHTTCGVQGMQSAEMLHLMEKRGVSPEAIAAVKASGVDLDRWLTGFEETDAAVLDSVELVKNHPLLPPGIKVSGYVMDTATGALREVE